MTTTHGAARLRRLARTISLAGAVTAVLAAQAIANAEWDIGKYDRCIAEVKFLYREGDISTMDMVQRYDACCISSGGQLNGTNCGAPPAISGTATPAPASEAANPDVASGSPPSNPGPKPPTPKTTFTLAPIAPVG